MKAKRPVFVHVRIQLFGPFERSHEFVDKYDFSVFFEYNTTLTLTKRALPEIYAMSLLYKWNGGDLRLNVRIRDLQHVDVYRGSRLYFSFQYDERKNRYDDLIDLIEEGLWRRLRKEGR